MKKPPFNCLKRGHPKNRFNLSHVSDYVLSPFRYSPASGSLAWVAFGHTGLARIVVDYSTTTMRFVAVWFAASN